MESKDMSQQNLFKSPDEQILDGMAQAIEMEMKIKGEAQATIGLAGYRMRDFRIPGYENETFEGQFVAWAKAKGWHAHHCPVTDLVFILVLPKKV